MLIMLCLSLHQVYVFDDTDPEMASYLGVARIPLMPLAHDKTIKGTFELLRVNMLKHGLFIYLIVRILRYALEQCIVQHYPVLVKYELMSHLLSIIMVL